MAKEVIMPALGMAQETGTLLRWFKAAGEVVTKGEPLMEVETDKAAVEIEAPASGTLAGVLAHEGDVIPVGQRIAVILAAGESATTIAPPSQPKPAATPQAEVQPRPVTATPVAVRLAAEQNIDLSLIKTTSGQIRKEDVLAYIEHQSKANGQHGKLLASPKAKRLAKEQGLDLTLVRSTGPDNAILVKDVLAYSPANVPATSFEPVSGQNETLAVSRVWQVMAERLTQAWTNIPHFYLIREANASRMLAWRETAQKSAAEKVTFTDLLVKVVAAALRKHPRLNASWLNNSIVLNPDVNIGLAIAVEDGLLVPVIHNADKLSLSQIASRRAELIGKAQAGKLSLNDLGGGTFTISNLGMYGVDAFNAIVNPPQAAILAVSRIADRVVPVNGQPAVQPMLTFSLSCDHRAVDGARGAQFLQTLAGFVEEPLQMMS